MNRHLVTLICWSLGGLASLMAAEAPPPMRPGGFDAQNLPKVVAPLDVKRTPNGWPPLNPQDFSLWEDGAKTSSGDRIIKFRDSDLGLALIVALDASGSMNGRPMAAIQKGLAQLVSRKRPADRMAVMSFADDTKWETHWDTSDQGTQEAFKNLQTRGKFTRLYDAVEGAMAEFSHQADKDHDFPIRRCVLIISDGHDEGSKTTLAQLLKDVGASRVRIDTVGLAHSPVWFGSLRQLSKAGFGESQAAASTESLTDMLGHGIDLLLDMPAIELTAKNLSKDGDSHRLGLENKAAGLQLAELSVKLPDPIWRTKKALYGAAAVLAVLLVGIVLASRSRTPKRTHTPSPTILETPVPSQPPSPPPPRAATVAEPGSRVMRPISTTPSIRYSALAPQTVMVAKPARVPTVLAQNPTAAAAANVSLTALSGPYAGMRFPITEQEFWIGSAANNHLCMPADEGVSGNHACIRTEAPFRRLYDNGSLNNTWLNGRALGPEVAVIQPGDRIRLGASDFLLESNGDA